MALANLNTSDFIKGTGVTQTGRVIEVAAGSGIPGGTDTQVQFNDAGVLAGDAGFTYDKTNNIIDLESIDFAVTPAAAAAVYRLNTDDSEGSLNLGLKGGNVNISLGGEVIIMSYNAEATTLNKGEVVYLFGAQGQRPAVKRASNTSDTTSARTFGIVAESIASGAEGFVIQIGILRNIDTNAYNEGDILWLGSTAGTVTTTKPSAPNHGVFVGVVLKKNAVSGRIFVKPQNGYELDEIHDVAISGLADGDLLAYENSTTLWKNKTKSALGIQGTLSLTTTGSSGSATLIANTLNVPTYTLIGLGGFANPMTTLGDVIYGGASGAATRLAGNITVVKQYLSQTGNGTASAAPVWSAIAGSDITGAALTKTDDTNVTLTLGGTPATALLRAASLTLGWTGQLAISRGGTGLSTLGTANQLLRVNAGATALEYFTPAYLTAAITTLNTLTAATQTFAVGTAGTDFAISSATSTHTFNLPTASAANRGALSSADWSTFNNKQATITLTTTGSSGAATFVTNTLNIPNYTLAGLGGFANPMTTLGDIIYGGTSGVATRLAGAAGFLKSTGAAAPTWSAIAGSDVTGAALTKTDDTNVTLTLGGTPTTALLRAASITVGWTGTLATGRGGTGLSTLGTANQLLRVNAGATALEYFTPTYLTAAITSLNGLTAATQTFANDTNVTITSVTSTHTIGWSGQLSVSRGGTGASTLTGVVIGTGTTAMTAVAGTANQLLRRNAGDTAYEFFTFSGMTNPMTTLGDIIYGGASGTPTRLAAGTSGQALVSAGGAAPVWTTLTLENLPGAFVKRAVRVATTGSNITLSAGAPNTLDGITLAANDRILVKDQTAPAQNGIYIVQTLGTGVNGTWVRSTDADASDEIASAIVPVDSGTVNGGFAFDNDFKTTDTLGTTAMVWSRIVDIAYLTANTVASISFGTTGLTPSTATTGAITVAGTLVAVNGGTGQSTYAVGDLLQGGATNTLTKLAAVATGNALISGGVTTASSWGKIGLTTHISGTLAVGNGGTGATTLTGVLIGNGTGAVTAVTGTASQLLRRNAGNTAYEFFTFTGLSNPMTTLGDIIYGAASGVATRLAGNITTAKQFLSQTGTGTVSAIPAWATITGADITGAALTKTDDTNVTLTLGGTPATSLLRAASLTLGWTGTLAVSRGGLGVGTVTGVMIGNGTSAVTAVAGTASQLLRRNAGNTAYEFFTPAFASAGSGNELQKSDGAGGFLGTDIFTATSSGTLTIGSTSTNLTRSITVENSTTDANLFLLAKGAGSVVIGSALYTQGFTTRTSSVVSMIVQTVNTNIVIPALSLEVQTSGTAAVGIGTGLNFSTETAVGVSKTGASIESVSTNITTATEAFSLVFKTMTVGALPTEKLRITSAGNVGIGTTSPSSKLDVNGSISISSLNAISKGSFYTQLHDYDGTVRIYLGGTGDPVNYYDNTTHLFRSAGGSEYARINSSGNVGIGTSSPASIGTGYTSVDTRGTNGGGFIMGTTTTLYGYVFASATGLILETVAGSPIIFNAGATEKMRIDSAGNIGIGTTTLTYKLNVNGDLGVSGIMYLPAATTETRAIEIGQGRTGNGISYIDLIGDATYTDYGLRILRNNTGANASTEFSHRGTGILAFQTIEASPILFTTTSAERMRITSAGDVIISTNTLYTYQPAQIVKTGAATLTGAELMAGILNTTAPGGTFTITLPTGTTIDSADSADSVVNSSFDWSIINGASGTVTIGANGNSTVGSLSVPTGTSARFRFRKTAANTYTVYRLS